MRAPLSFLLLCFAATATGTVQGRSERPLEKVTLQLKWKHQFQFAGYYAAVSRGFYREAGLEVVLRECEPNMIPVDEVLSGRAQYGIGMPTLLLHRQAGKPVVVLAAIFQHSPEIVVSRKDAGISSPHDLVGKRLMMRPWDNLETEAMLQSENVPLKEVEILEHSWNIEDLVEGKVDAATGYITDRPFLLEQRGIPYSILRPLVYGIDFYGDCLFTSEEELESHPERVASFLEASLRGWKYAMENPKEIVDLILERFPSELSREALLYEAEAMRELIQPKFIELGHMNPGRWSHIVTTLEGLGLLNPGFSLDGFLYDPNPRPDTSGIRRAIWILVAVVIGGAAWVVILVFYNRRLEREVGIRTERLAEEKKFTDAVIKSLPAVFYVYEDGKRLIRWNENLQAESGLTDSEILNRSPSDWVRGEHKERIRKAVATVFEKGHAEIEAPVVMKDGELPFFFTGTKLENGGRRYLVGVGLDLSQKKLLEEQLRHAQKMESIGRLAGGIAHDFNNILTTILGYGELLALELPEGGPQRRMIEAINCAGEKGEALTRQLLAFSRKQILEIKPLRIDDVVESLFKILAKMLGDDIEVELRAEADPGIIEADRGQVEQVLMNLAVNARDAMPRGGKIRIETRNLRIGRGEIPEGLQAEPGEYVRIRVEDWGEGMDEETLTRIFDPFFTTKELGKGTGLGLSTVHGIVEQHGGFIRTRSAVGEGTVFDIHFPASPKVPVLEETVEARSMPEGSESILVVDDESAVRDLVRDTLQPLGYRVLEASSGKEALSLLRESGEEVDLVLTDLNMPGMSGREFAEELSRREKSPPVLFMSGYPDMELRAGEDLETSMIRKPIRPGELARWIRNVLDGKWARKPVVP